MNRRKLRWLALVTVCALVVFSLLPLRARATLHGTSGHLVLHVIAFGLTTSLCLIVAEKRLYQWFCLFLMFALATAIESGQCVVFRQHMEWSDVLLDFAGSLSAFGLVPLGQLLTPKTWWNP